MTNDDPGVPSMRFFNAGYKYSIVFFAAMIGGAGTVAEPLPDPMVSNLFALTDVAASLRICAKSRAYQALTDSDKTAIHRLTRNIDDLVTSIAETFDPSLVDFYKAQRAELAESPPKVHEMEQKYGFCGNGMIADIRRYVYASKKTLDAFFKAYNRR